LPQTVLTPGLIDAASSLPAAERALLDLWVNRGLDDERLAAMSGVSSDVIEARRARIVQRLSQKLRMPTVEVQEALDPPSPRRRRGLWAAIGTLLVLCVLRRARSGRDSHRRG